MDLKKRKRKALPIMLIVFYDLSDSHVGLKRSFNRALGCHITLILFIYLFLGR